MVTSSKRSLGINALLNDPPIVPTTVGKMMELRCVVAVIRHGDRTPKQKMKLEVKHPMFFDLFKTNQLLPDVLK